MTWQDDMDLGLAREPESIIEAIEQFDARRTRTIAALELNNAELLVEVKKLRNEAFATAQANSRALLASILGGAIITKEERELLDAVALIEKRSKENVNSFTEVSRDIHGMWGARGTFAYRAGITFSDAVLAAAQALR